ncbi:hypothetical protein BH11PSE7_BH11PSE7_09620 [soil metagenome]|jgi:hypothetical protein
MIIKTSKVHWEGQGAKRDCPLANALASVPEIELQATLRKA